VRCRVVIPRICRHLPCRLDHWSCASLRRQWMRCCSASPIPFVAIGSLRVMWPTNCVRPFGARQG